MFITMSCTTYGCDDGRTARKLENGKTYYVGRSLAVALINNGQAIQADVTDPQAEKYLNAHTHNISYNDYNDYKEAL